MEVIAIFPKGIRSNEFESFTYDEFFEKKDYNFLLIRPGEKKGKYILVIHEGNFEFSILGWFPYTSDESMQHRLTNFGYAQRPPVYKVDIKELYNMNDL